MLKPGCYIVFSIMPKRSRSRSKEKDRDERKNNKKFKSMQEQIDKLTKTMADFIESQKLNLNKGMYKFPLKKLPI